MDAESDQFPPGATTLHLLPHEVWERAKNLPEYVPEAFAADGFVHCTNGDDEMVAVGNRYYRGDPRPFLVLTIAVDALRSPVRYDDVKRLFPHVYGPINREAVIGARRVIRDRDGVFVSISSDETTL
jgi:uncharacterized protein (DUF952 family)